MDRSARNLLSASEGQPVAVEGAEVAGNANDIQDIPELDNRKPCPLKPVPRRSVR